MKITSPFGPIRPLAQIGAGIDGVSYRATLQNELVELRVLTGARSDSSRWDSLVKRLRLAALLDHPGALRVRLLALEVDPPHLVLEWREPEARNSALDPAGLLRALANLAGGLAEAHRLGLVHGQLAHRRVREELLNRGGRLDFTGTKIVADEGSGGSPESRPSSTSQGEGRAPDFSADVSDLGTLLEAVEPRLGLSAGGDVAAELAGLIRETRAAEPADRPTAAAIRDRLVRLGECPDPGWAFDQPDAEPDGEGMPSGEFVVPPAPIECSPREGRGRVRLQERLGRPTSETPRQAPQQLGRYRILESLGKGGMGEVYRAEDLADGSIVAIKVQDPEWSRRPEALRRFRKEARLLSEFNNPFITNLLEANEDGGVPFIVLEYVKGTSLGKRLAGGLALPEREALTILADVARALADAHGRGIVHRDVKPDNILLMGPTAAEDTGFVVEDGECSFEVDEGHLPSPEGNAANLTLVPEAPRVKLSDFGIARRIFETESLTLPGGVLGTPLYMAPEQGAGGSIGPPADVYALGATLYQMLTGRPPFQAGDFFALLVKHRDEDPTPLRSLVPGISDGAVHIVETALAKAAGARYPDASALLWDIEALLRGVPIRAADHPRLPESPESEVMEYRFTWELDASARDLWPLVSDTERLNRAVGLPAVTFTTQPGGPRGARQVGTFRKLGLRATWEEHPFEWVEGRRMGVLREYQQGPVRWLASVVELTPRADGGTTLLHHVRLSPRGLLGRAVMHLEVGIRGRMALDRVYRRIDRSVRGSVVPGVTDHGHVGNECDPFEAAASPAGLRRHRLQAGLEGLKARDVSPVLVDRLGEFLAEGSPQEVARIRPLAIAHRWEADPEAVVAACMLAAGEGLLVLSWELICPACRLPSQTLPSLRNLPDRHGRCEVCQLDFELDFAESVELIFRADPRVRGADAGIYCIGGPAHFPHVAAQVRAAPGERVELDLALAPGSYRVRAPQLPYTFEFRVEPTATPGLLELALDIGPSPTTPKVLRAGAQRLTFTNGRDGEVVLRVERVAARFDALTAARASSLAIFRALFPAEVLSPGQMVKVTHVTVLLTGLDDPAGLYERLGDARAFGLIHDQLRRQGDAVRRGGGTSVKTLGDGLLAAFADPVDATRTALALVAESGGRPGGPSLAPKVVVHQGAALAATLDDRLDYFGATLARAGLLLGSAKGGEVILSDTVAADPAVAALLNASCWEGTPRLFPDAGRALAVEPRPPT